jgi:hypothetical protein
MSNDRNVNWKWDSFGSSVMLCSIFKDIVAFAAFQLWNRGREEWFQKSQYILWTIVLKIVR